MSDQQNTPSAREVWLNVALAVARDGMPQPRELTVRDNDGAPRVNLTFDAFEPAATWADRLALSPTHREIVSTDGLRRIITYSGFLSGWHWSVTAYAPVTMAVPSDLANQVTTAILDTIDPIVDPDDTGDVFAEHLVDGSCNTDPVCTQHWGHSGECTPESTINMCPEPGCGYGIADGPVPDGEPTTDELLSEHVQEHAIDRADDFDAPEWVSALAAETASAPNPHYACHTMGNPPCPTGRHTAANRNGTSTMFPLSEV